MWCPSQKLCDLSEFFKHHPLSDAGLQMCLPLCFSQSRADIPGATQHQAVSVLFHQSVCLLYENTMLAVFHKGIFLLVENVLNYVHVLNHPLPRLLQLSLLLSETLSSALAHMHVMYRYR